MHESSLRAPLHADNPYAFKVFALEAAIKAGYESILWLDSSAYAVGDVSPIFRLIEQDGYFFHPDGNMLGVWSNDRLLEYYGLTRDEAMAIPMVKGGMWGINAQHRVGYELRKACDAGIFRGAWNNNTNSESSDERCRGARHEMSALSAIVYQLGLTIQPGESLIETGGVFDDIRGENIVIKYQGL
jgi:hypothetical protein